MNRFQKLFLDSPQEYKRFMLSYPQLSIYKFVRNNPGSSSRDISDAMDISIQSASVRLKVLYEREYLQRTEIASETGGIEFIYEVMQ